MASNFKIFCILVVEFTNSHPARAGWNYKPTISVEDDDLDISPALAAKIEKARKEHKEGKTLRFENATAAQKWMDEL